MDLKVYPKHLEIEFYDAASANAFSVSCARELLGIVRAERKTHKPLIVRSRHPRIFCAGGNLREHKALKNRAEGLRQAREITRALDAFAAWPIAKLAVIEGDCLGGGMEWLARFNARITTGHCAFGFWQADLGLSFGWGGGRAWSKWIGEAAVKKLLLEPRLISAFEAKTLGLVDEIVSPHQILSHARAWAEQQSQNPASLQKWSVAHESAHFGQLWWGKAHLAALKNWPRRL